MTSLLIIGAGGHAKVLAETALSEQRWSRIAFVDDRARVGDRVIGLEIVGSTAQLESLARDYTHAVVGIGDAQVRLDFLSRCHELGLQRPSIVHRTAWVSSFASLGAGTVVFAQAAINAGCAIGDGCIVNTGAVVDHDCILGNVVHICPGAHLAGNVRVGDGAWIGIGSCVRQGISVGSRALVAAGAAVMANVDSNVTVMGVPARVRKQADA